MGSPAARRERLSAADASNIVIDAPDQVNAFLMAGVLAPGGPIGPDGEVDLRALRTSLDELIPSEPRLSQRVVRDGRRFAWEHVPVDLEAQVRLAEPVDGLSGLERLCARLMVTAIPTDRPLWELLLVPGVARGRVGVILRIHHAMADGLAAVRIVEVLLGPNGTARPAAGAVAPDDRIEPPATAGPVASPRPGLRARLRMLASGCERTAAVLHPAVPRTVLLGPIGPRRGVAFVDAPLDAIAAGAGAIGATVNDALLAAASAAAEAALRSRGEPIPPILPTSVPVALGAHGRSGNAVGVMLVPLPTGETDAATRLDRIAALTRDRKADARSRGQFELTRTRTGTAVFRRLVRFQRLIVMFVTNVPGPRHRLALAGATLERAWPVSAIQGNVRLAVAALSYDGMLQCAVHCDADAIPVAAFAAALRSEFERIAALA